MPNRQMVGGELYRYAFQGQEKDPETGKEAFQLRLWDGRIGRWLTTDPMHEFASPYLGMGNNPIVLTDPDGGSTDNEYLIRRDGSKEQIGTRGGDLVDYYSFEFGHQDYGRMFVVNKLFGFSTWTNQFTPVDDYNGFIDDFKSDIFKKSIGQSVDNYRFSTKLELFNSTSIQIDKILFNHGVPGNSLTPSSIDKSEVVGLAFDLGQPIINKVIDNKVNRRVLKFMFKGASETIGLYLSSQSLGGPTPQQYRQGNISFVKTEVNNYFNKNIDFSTYFNIYIGRKF